MPRRDEITFTIYMVCAIIEVSTFGEILCSQKRSGVRSLIWGTFSVMIYEPLMFIFFEEKIYRWPCKFCFNSDSLQL
jgi:hypothetical protein